MRLLNQPARRAGTYLRDTSCAATDEETEISLFQTDEELMALVAKKDKNAFALIVKRYLHKAEAHAKNFVRAEPFEDEIIQDIFIRIWKYATKWNPSKGLFRSWFHCIAVKTCCSYAKKNKRRFDNRDITNICDPECDLETFFIRQQETSGLINNLMCLNEREQQVISLRYFQGFSNEETADILGSTVKAIESLLVRAKEKLRKLYDKEKKNG
jgi:RNA polymerase sigma-70 factor, ECF subfamily